MVFSLSEHYLGSLPSKLFTVDTILILQDFSDNK